MNNKSKAIKKDKIQNISQRRTYATRSNALREEDVLNIPHIQEQPLQPNEEVKASHPPNEDMPAQPQRIFQIKRSTHPKKRTPPRAKCFKELRCTEKISPALKNLKKGLASSLLPPLESAAFSKSWVDAFPRGQVVYQRFPQPTFIKAFKNLFCIQLHRDDPVVEDTNLFERNPFFSPPEYLTPSQQSAEEDVWYARHRIELNLRLEHTQNLNMDRVDGLPQSYLLWRQRKYLSEMASVSAFFERANLGGDDRSDSQSDFTRQSGYNADYLYSESSLYSEAPTFLIVDNTEPAFDYDAAMSRHIMEEMAIEQMEEERLHDNWEDYGMGSD